MENKGDILLSPQIRGEVDELIRDGVKKLGVYHVEKPLVFNKKGELVSQDFRLLFFYYNRLEKYPLGKGINWAREAIDRQMAMEPAMKES